jgi:protein SDA1
MQLTARVMGTHKNTVLGFYTYILRYLTYHQLRVPAILVALAQSVHELTPPDVLTPVIQKLAHEFVHPGVGSEVIAAGLNAIREICRRQPWAMEEDLLGDLIEYRKSKEKTVIAAARGLLQLYREVNPGMLKRRERVSCLVDFNIFADFINVALLGQGGEHGSWQRFSTLTFWSQRRCCCRH